MTRIEEIRAKLPSYPVDSPVRVDLEYLLGFISAIESYRNSAESLNQSETGISANAAVYFYVACDRAIGALHA